MQDRPAQSLMFRFALRFAALLALTLAVLAGVAVEAGSDETPAAPAAVQVTASVGRP